MEKDYYQLELDDMVIALENKDYEIERLKKLLEECIDWLTYIDRDNGIIAKIDKVLK